jgi:phospholipid transport system substrate-binding protein
MKNLILSFLIILFTISNVSAEKDIIASELIENTVLEVQKTVREFSTKISQIELDKKLKEQISPVFDFQEMSKRCLGINWKKATNEEQTEFQKLFSELLAKNYIKQIREKSLGSKFELAKSHEEGEKATVQTVVTTKNGTLKIDYRLYKSENTWKVYDVMIENIGLVSNYRSEFSDIINKEGMSGLLVRLREKL